MSRKNRTPEENARRAKIRELLQEANITSMADIQSLFKETIAEFMENGLEAELDEELGYSKYDYRNKETDNSRNGHSSKKLKTSFGDVEISTPRDRKGEFEPQLLKKNQTSISQDIEESKTVFPTDDSLLKMLYLAMMDITKKWTGRRQDWSVIHAQLAIYYADRMSG